MKLIVTEHVATAAVPDRVHVPEGMNVTVPVGVVAPVEDTSVTVAVQVVASPITTVVGTHATEVVVGCEVGCEMLTVALPELGEWLESPG